MKKLLLFAALLLVSPLNVLAQNLTLTGKVADATDTGALTGVTIIVTNLADTTQKNGTVTDIDGKFKITNIVPGTYTLRCNYVGYNTLVRNLTFSTQNVELGTLKLTATNKELKNVTIGGVQTRVDQKGDTTSFNAGAYKTNVDASAEDLITKMPGVTSDGNGVKVNGENVQQILVDGKPFFGTDPAMALKNLPSEVIDKIQVFDKLSDQAQFTGFDDGSTQKTINILTKRGKSEGVFGKVYAGYGTDDRYLVGGNLNIFNGDRRITILGLSNNINQQNFSSEDVLGIAASSGQNRGGGSRGGGGGRGGFGGQGGGNSGSGSNNFMVGQQGGIATTTSAGFNYTDTWGKKIKFTGSYFLNKTDVVNNSGIVRNYFSTADTNTVYRENTISEVNNMNHRFNARFEYTIDSFNSLTVTPNLSLQDNRNKTTTIASNTLGNLLTGTTTTNTGANNIGYNFSNNLLYQHKFGKPRRTISLNINNGLNNKKGDGLYASLNQYINKDTIIDQQYDLTSNGNSISANVTYTEPVGKNGQIMANYAPGITQNNSDRQTYNKNGVTSDYDVLDTFLSNKYDNTYTTHKGGLSYRISDKKLTFMAGANVQYATLDGVQEFPYSFNLQRTFTNILPTIHFNYRDRDGKNLRINYRTNTAAPGITQLQDVIDISNPLLLKTGNPDLKQNYEHTLIARYSLTKSKKGHSLFLFLYSGYTNDYIGNATYLPSKDSLFKGPLSANSVLIRKGSQLTMPVNIDGYFSERLFVTYGTPIKPIKCNINFNGGVNYTRTPGKVNDVINYSDNYAPTWGFVLSSNISEQIDFALSYTGNYNIVTNTVQSQSNNNYYSHVASFRMNYLYKERLVLNSNIAQSYFTAFSNTPDQSFILWNAYAGYKLMKDKALEVRLSVYDILNQNKSITNTVTETYVENNVTQVLQQYFMLQLVYTIRKFKGAMPEMEKREGPMMPGRPDGPGGFRRNEDMR